MKRKWLFLGTTVLAVLLSLCFFGVRLRIAPRWILSRVLGTAFKEMEIRFDNSPVHLIMPALDMEGHQKTDLQLETQLEHLGVVRYDMLLQTQLNPSRVNALGNVVAGGKMLDLQLYLDQNFAAVSSQGLLDGNYYGITYDSFSQDIRSRELLAVLIGEKTISQWEEAICGLQKSMSGNVSMPELAIEDIPGMLYGLLVLKPQVGREEIMISGQQENAYTVSFRTTGPEIAAMVESYLDQMDSKLQNLLHELKDTPDAAVHAVFFLYNEKLVRIDFSLFFPEKSVQIQVELGHAPVTDPLSLELQIQEGDDLRRFTMRVETESGKNHYAEKIYLSHTENGVISSGFLDYNWELSSGEMKLSLIENDQKAYVRLNLSGEGESLTIRTQDAAPLLNLFLQKPINYPVICTLNLKPGNSVAVPEYQNLDQWSLEDLYTLLTGLGGLLGLQIP